MMKKFTSLLIGCSLALAGAALAQQPDEQSTPKEKQEKTHEAKAKPANTAKPEATIAREHGAKALKTEATPKSEKTTGTETKVSGEPAASATPSAEHGRKGMKSAGENAKTSATPATAAGTATPVKGAKKTATPVTAAASATPAASASAAPTVAATGQQNATANKGAAAKKPDPQQVQQIKVQHESFKAQPRPDKVPTVTFSASYRIQGSDRWQGPQYEVYRSYHPERHDQGWYRSHYNRVELIGGGYYYWNNNGYWYPAWGYDSSAEYYAYDAPIYVGHSAEPPDRVIADVQAVLQNMGYYKGEVDGLLGPMTREALTGYQADQGLTGTAVIDEPTLDSLGMGS
jgi:Putative peptidoglycan binding domain